jgi:hypothetical protein
MELEKVKRISNKLERDIAISKIRTILSGLIILVLIVCLAYAANQSNFVVVDKISGAVSVGTKADRTEPEILLIECDAHLRLFYSKFYSFAHHNINKPLDEATFLGGNCIKELYQVYKSRGFYNSIQANNYVVTSTIDSVESFTFDGRGISVITRGTMVLENDQIVDERKLDLQFYIILVDRVRQRNPHGMSIEKINVLSTETIREYNK